jgi:hypothetical protein
MEAGDKRKLKERELSKLVRITTEGEGLGN